LGYFSGMLPSASLRPQLSYLGLHKAGWQACTATPSWFGCDQSWGRESLSNFLPRLASNYSLLCSPHPE
jgi:hypothetical protein